MTFFFLREVTNNLRKGHLTIPKKATKNCQDVGNSSFPEKKTGWVRVAMSARKHVQDNFIPFFHMKMQRVCQVGHRGR